MGASIAQSQWFGVSIVIACARRVPFSFSALQSFTIDLSAAQGGPQRWVTMDVLPRLEIRRAGVAGAMVAMVLAGCVVAPVHAPPPRSDLPPPVASAPRSQARPMYFYPEQSQDDARQDRDRYECYRWAVRESGVDPGMTPVREVPPPRAAARDGGEVVAGAATGAVAGAIVGGPRRGAEGAIIGAIFGTLVGAAAQESRVQAAEAAHARRQAQAQVPMDNFRRAMSACMQGRGYRVG